LPRALRPGEDGCALVPPLFGPALTRSGGSVLGEHARLRRFDEAVPKKPVDETALLCGEAEIEAGALGLLPVIGIDEAGRGPLAGPVVAAAVALPWPCPVDGIDDSKRLTEEERDALHEPILKAALGVGVAIVEPADIDRLNILRASLHGMALARARLLEHRPDLATALVLVDGRDPAPLPPDAIQRPLIKGDSRSVNVAAASIVAKVTRDRLMVEAHARWPRYGFDRHKGYPTPAHRRALLELGPCPLHRRSFGLVAKAWARFDRGDAHRDG
jgi:ribonuclease HII